MKKVLSQHILLLIFLMAYAMLPAQNQVVGTVLYHDNESNPVYDVNLELLNNSNQVVATAITNMYGEFEFNNIPNGEYTIVGNANLPVGDVNLIDASLILQYLFGMTTFNDYEFDAADVNNSGNVTFGDYVLVLVSYLTQGNPFPADDWQFEEVTLELNSSRDLGDADTTKMYGTSTGDVEGIWLPTGRSLALTNAEYTETTISEEYADINVGSDFNNYIAGYHMDLVYPTNLIEVVELTGIDENLHYDIDTEQGIITVSWLDETPDMMANGNKLFTIKVRAINNTSLEGSQPISLYENCMILDAKSNPVEDVTIQLPKISTAVNEQEFELDVKSYPNPAANNLNIEITSPCDDIANINIYDMSGRIVKTIDNISVTKGVQTIETETGSFTSGSYLYMIKFNNNNTIRGRFNKAD